MPRNPDPDRDLPDPGVERDDEPTCRWCGEPVEDERSKECDTCIHGPQDRPDDV